jgi:hypothetical protein
MFGSFPPSPWLFALPKSTRAWEPTLFMESLHSPTADSVGINLRVTNHSSVTNQIKEMAQRSELYVLRRAHGIYLNLVPVLRLRSMEAFCLAGEGNSRIDVNVM